MPSQPVKYRPPTKASSFESILRAWLGSLLGIGTIAWLASLKFAGSDYLLLVGSFGASSVLLFAAPSSPFAQPRNLFGGHALSAMIGSAVYLLMHNHPILAPAIAVATAIAAMQASSTLHPPGGATALIAVIGGTSVHQLGFAYVVPILIGAAVLFISALASQNLFSKVRHYPEYWW
ncbi:MAG: HPP family protein [Gammaproteobacteria bacterium]|nr:HPP family protein [Gammaproteobacteria bacterium]MBU1653948.1 HPP family protein [Gammaproteobacteria bacterium]MBU1962648.1 HPP family protein [Gammaproteobacteria bacterium]